MSLPLSVFHTCSPGGGFPGGGEAVSGHWLVAAPSAGKFSFPTNTTFIVIIEMLVVVLLPVHQGSAFLQLRETARGSLILKAFIFSQNAF